MRKLVLAALLAIGCNYENNCNYSGEFSLEKNKLCEQGARVEDINENTPLEEICDIVEIIQDTTADTFLDHTWIKAGPDNYTIFVGFEDVSAMYIPGKEFDHIQGLQCYRIIDEPNDPNRVYGCRLSSGNTHLTPDLAFNLVSAGAGFQPYLQTRFRYNEIASPHLIETVLGYTEEDEFLATLLNHDSGEVYQALCPKANQSNFNQRVIDLEKFAEALWEQ